MKNKSRGLILGTVFGIALAAAGAFGALKIFNLKVEKDVPEVPVEKYDYHKIDLTNDYDSLQVTQENLEILVGIDTEKEKEASIIDSLSFSTTNPIYLDSGGVRLGTKTKPGDLSIVFKEHFDHYLFNAIAYNAPVYIDSANGITTPVVDEDGNKVVQSWNCDESILGITPTMGITAATSAPVNKQLNDNNGELRAPEATGCEFDASGSLYETIRGFSLVPRMTVSSPTSQYGRIILLSIEVWNDTAPEVEEPAVEDSTTTSTSSAEVSA